MLLPFAKNQLRHEKAAQDKEQICPHPSAGPGDLREFSDAGAKNSSVGSTLKALQMPECQQGHRDKPQDIMAEDPPDRIFFYGGNRRHSWNFWLGLGERRVKGRHPNIVSPVGAMG